MKRGNSVGCSLNYTLHTRLLAYVKRKGLVLAQFVREAIVEKLNRDEN